MINITIVMQISRRVIAAEEEEMTAVPNVNFAFTFEAFMVSIIFGINFMPKI